MDQLSASICCSIMPSPTTGCSFFFSNCSMYAFLRGFFCNLEEGSAFKHLPRSHPSRCCLPSPRSLSIVNYSLLTTHCCMPETAEVEAQLEGSSLRASMRACSSCLFLVSYYQWPSFLSHSSSMLDVTICRGNARKPPSHRPSALSCYILSNLRSKPLEASAASIHPPPQDLARCAPQQ